MKDLNNLYEDQDKLKVEFDYLVECADNATDVEEAQTILNKLENTKNKLVNVNKRIINKMQQLRQLEMLYGTLHEE